jgi:hypothetical protein
MTSAQANKKVFKLLNEVGDVPADLASVSSKNLTKLIEAGLLMVENGSPMAAKIASRKLAEYTAEQIRRERL